MKIATAFEIVEGTGQIIGQDIAQTISNGLHDDSDDLYLYLYSGVMVRTPVRSGALASSIYGKGGHNYDSATLAYVGTHAAEQVAEYGHVYAQYVEGGPLGDASKSSPEPAEMFYGAATDTSTYDFIDTWATASIERSVQLCADGKGVPL